MKKKADLSDSSFILHPSSYKIGPPQRLLSNTSEWHWGFSADGQTIAMPNGDLGAVVLHRGPPQRTVRLEPQQDVPACAVSPDGRWVASGSKSNTDGFGVKVWEAATGRLVKAFVAGESFVAFSPDGRWLLTGGDGWRLWQVGTWTEGPAVGGAGECFAPDGRHMAVEDSAGAIRLVSTDTGALVVRAGNARRNPPDPPVLHSRWHAPDRNRDGYRRAAHLGSAGSAPRPGRAWARLGRATLSTTHPERRGRGRKGTTTPLQVTVDPGELSRVSGPG